MKSPITLALTAMFAIATALIAIATPEPSTPIMNYEEFGVAEESFTFPESDQIWAGKVVQLTECKFFTATDQKILVTRNGNKVNFYHNALIPRGQQADCLQAVDYTDPAQMARMANWWMRSAHINGYQASVLAKP